MLHAHLQSKGCLKLYVGGDIIKIKLRKFKYLNDWYLSYELDISKKMSDYSFWFLWMNLLLLFFSTSVFCIYVVILLYL
jgi:hypothetical protein